MEDFAETQPSSPIVARKEPNGSEHLDGHEQDPSLVCSLVCITGQLKQWDLHCKQQDSKTSWLFGRNPQCDFTFMDTKRLSNRHMRITWTSGMLLLQDLSTNGTYLNNCKVDKDKRYILAHGDEISVGLGVATDEMRFIVRLPNRTVQRPTEGIHAVYDIQEIIGKGAFASVRKGIERESGECYAIKIIEKSGLAAAGASPAIRREVDILKQLDHPNIVRLKDCFEDPKNVYLVMEHLGEGDLMDYITKHGALSENTAREVIRQVLQGVNYVHSLGISHRDLKPDNILIASLDPMTVKVTDFGLAKISGGGTFLKTFCGTIAYLAPEVIDRKTKKIHGYSNAVDMWSIGCLAFVVLSRYLPFDGSTQEELYRRICKGEYFDSYLEEVGASKEAQDFIRKTLHVDPRFRPTASEGLQHPWFHMPNASSSDGDKLEVKRSQTNEALKQETVPPTSIIHAPSVDIIEDSNKGNYEAGYDNHESEPRPKHDDEVNSDSDDSEVQLHAQLECSQRSLARLEIQKQQRSSEASQQSISNNSNNDNQEVGDVRDLDNYDPADSKDPFEPMDTWLILRTLPESIPHADIYCNKSTFSIGRLSDGNNICISDKRMSKKHCQITLVAEDQMDDDKGDLATQKIGEKDYKIQVALFDLSTNGCFVNGCHIGKGKSVNLNSGDSLLLFREGDEFCGFTVELNEENMNKCEPVDEEHLLATGISAGTLKQFNTPEIQNNAPRNTTPLADMENPRVMDHGSSPLMNKRDRQESLRLAKGMGPPRKKEKMVRQANAIV